MIVGCPSCSKKNRIDLSKLPKAGHCGHCKEPFGQIAVPIEVDTRAFDEVLKTSALPVLVDFWAPWCGPCVRAAPEVAKAAKLLAGRALVLKIDTEKHPDIAQRYGIQGIPYFAVFTGGRKTTDRTGLQDANALVSMIR